MSRTRQLRAGSCSLNSFLPTCPGSGRARAGMLGFTSGTAPEGTENVKLERKSSVCSQPSSPGAVAALWQILDSLRLEKNSKNHQFLPESHHAQQSSEGKGCPLQVSPGKQLRQIWEWEAAHSQALGVFVAAVGEGGRVLGAARAVLPCSESWSRPQPRRLRGTDITRTESKRH